MSDKGNKKIGLLGAISIGVGGMVGGGIFAVLGEAVTMAHGATWFAFLISGLVAFLTAYSYSKFSVRYQNSGGTVIFIDKAFNHNLLSGSVNTILWLSYIVTISLYAVAFASYGETFFHGVSGGVLRHVLITVAILLPGIINLVNASIVSESETFVVVLKLLLLAVIIVTGVFFMDFSKVTYQVWQNPFSVTVAGMVIFVAYEGFELIANSAEDIKNPSVNLPRAFFISVAFVTLLYILIAALTVGSVSEPELVKYQDYALAVAAKPALGQIGFTLVSAAALLATFSAINATIYGNARLGYMMAESGELPREIIELNKGIPDRSILVTVALSLVLANSIDIKQIAIIGSASFLLVFSIVNISAWKMNREIKSNKMINAVASVATVCALAALLFHTFFTDKKSLIIFLLFMVIAVVFEYVYSKFFRGPFLPSSN